MSARLQILVYRGSTTSLLIWHQVLFLAYGGTFSTTVAEDVENGKVGKLLQELVSRNSAPELKKHEIRELLPLGPNEVPIFPQDFDWENQKKIIQAAVRLAKTDSIEAWEELLKHLDDDRYCFTWRVDAYRDPINFSVGDVCSRLAHNRLNQLFLKVLEDKGFDERDRPIFIEYKSEDMNDLRKWREARSHFTLDQLQLEVGQRILDAVPTIKFISDKTRAELRQEITDKMDEIKRKQAPLQTHLGSDEFFTYTAADAKKIREKLAK